MSDLSKLRKLFDKGYRDAFLETRVKSAIAYQIQALRLQRGLSQAEFGALIGKPQSVISRLEGTEYGGVNISTLLEIAAALEVGLQVRFCSFAELLAEDVSPAGMEVEPISQTAERAATNINAPPVAEVKLGEPADLLIANQVEGYSLWQLTLNPIPPARSIFQGSGTQTFVRSIQTQH